MKMSDAASDAAARVGKLADSSFFRRVVALCVIVTLCVLFVVRFDGVKAVLGAAWEIVSPFVIGLVLAYLLNIIMRQWEKLLLSRSSHPIVQRIARPCSLILSIATVAAFVAVLVVLVSDGLKESLLALKEGFSTILSQASAAVSSNEDLAALLPDDMSNLEQMAQSAVESLGGASSIVKQVAHWGENVVNAVVDAVIALVFALYVLVGKERCLQGAQHAGQLILPPRAYNVVAHVCSVFNDNFSRFIAGQCIEACILGTLCVLGMTILGFPYAMSIGLCVGATSLVPFIGAWIGGTVGALMIASVSIEQALWFVVFLIVLQQIEGHFIYPNVVGNSVGMPGIWTFVAVVAGGSLFGFFGVLLGVPTVSSIRQLVLEAIEKKEGGEQHGEQKPPDDGKPDEVQDCLGR